MCHALKGGRDLPAPFTFTVTARDPSSRARTGVFTTPHGEVRTPAFMPVGTLASVKGLSPEQVRATGADMVLANAYHLMLRPGAERVASLGGLHRFMKWPGSILTDSGGFQVMSLASLVEVRDDGVTFRSHVDGSLHELGPERSMQVQEALGADVIMAFDHLVPLPSPRSVVEDALERTERWARRCVEAKTRADQALFAIVQGGLEPDLRRQGARALAALDLPGYAVGGLSVGEPAEDMYRALDWTVPELPEDRPRYLMGVGEPVQLLEGVARGIDLFDCVLPTRMARTGTAMVRGGRLNLRNARFADDPRPIEEGCDCYACAGFSRAYIRHLVKSGEMFGLTLVSIHNLRHLARWMERIRAAIAEGSLDALRREEEAASDGGADPGEDDPTR